MKWDYFKYHALGNDYIVIDPNITNMEMKKEKIKLICDRNFGIGSDGILYGPILNGQEISLKILNPDGSEAEKSGNGIRIFSKYLLDADYVRDNKFSLNTLGGKVAVEIIDAKGQLIKVDMGNVTFLSNEIPVNGQPREVVDELLESNNEKFRITCLSIGNPHCVIPMAEISKQIAKQIGPKIENHPLFPNRINMQILKVIDRNNIQIEIWERGAGYTLASGSSSCAAASAAFKLGLVDNEVKVHMPGGVIQVNIKNDGHILMTGSVNSVSKGVFTEEFWMNIR